MGIKQSIYEKLGTLDYYRFTAEEYAQVKKIWSEIEINPQFHGSAFIRSFCETYPQYMKYFTLETRLPVNFDARTMAKFSLIMESMGYLLLDFKNKPKQLDRFVGYIAMVHKDMRLNEQDMHNLISSLFEYLSQTFSTQMTAQCHEAMSNYMNSIIKELCKKMETFRGYDVTQSDVAAPKLLWGRCTFFVDPLIFGKTRFYWNEWKKQWDTRLDEWTAQSPVKTVTMSLPDEEGIITRKSIVDGDEPETGILQRKISALAQKRRMSDVSATRLALLSLSKTSEIDEIERPPSRSQRDITRRRSTHRTNEHRQQQQRSVRRSQRAASSRERHRAKSPIRNAFKSQADATQTLRRRLRSSMIIDHRTDETTPGEDDGMLERSAEIVPKSRNTARERRRKRFNLNLE